MTKHKKSLVPTPTKGKGGGKPGKGGPGGKAEGGTVDLRDSPLDLKDWEGPECPRYTGILKRGDTEVCSILRNGSMGSILRNGAMGSILRMRSGVQGSLRR
jgi:hypothetical protein